MQLLFLLNVFICHAMIGRPIKTLFKYVHVLNDIDVICNMINANYVRIGGDLNTDLTRGVLSNKWIS